MPRDKRSIVKFTFFFDFRGGEIYIFLTCHLCLQRRELLMRGFFPMFLPFTHVSMWILWTWLCIHCPRISVYLAQIETLFILLLPRGVFLQKIASRCWKRWYLGKCKTDALKDSRIWRFLAHSRTMAPFRHSYVKLNTEYLFPHFDRRPKRLPLHFRNLFSKRSLLLCSRCSYSCKRKVTRV